MAVQLAVRCSRIRHARWITKCAIDRQRTTSARRDAPSQERGIPGNSRQYSTGVARRLSGAAGTANGMNSVDAVCRLFSRFYDFWISRRNLVDSRHGLASNRLLSHFHINDFRLAWWAVPTLWKRLRQWNQVEPIENVAEFVRIPNVWRQSCRRPLCAGFPLPRGPMRRTLKSF